MDAEGAGSGTGIATSAPERPAVAAWVASEVRSKSRDAVRQNSADPLLLECRATGPTIVSRARRSTSGVDGSTGSSDPSDVARPNGRGRKAAGGTTMREPSVVAANHGRGARLAALFLGLVPLTGLLAACGGGGGDGGDDDASGDMLVERVTPTNGQETLANLSDPDLNGRLTMVLSGIPTASSIIDPQNAVNLLTPNVQI